MGFHAAFLRAAILMGRLPFQKSVKHSAKGVQTKNVEGIKEETIGSNFRKFHVSIGPKKE